MHVQVCVSVKLFSTSEGSRCLGVVPEEANITPIFRESYQEDSGSCRLVSLTSVIVEVVEKIIMKNSHMKDKKITGSSQHGFTKERSHLTSLIIFYDLK